MRRKHPLTLIEIMIAIAIITLIGGVVGFNMTKVLERGKKFRTERAIDQVKEIVMLESVNKGYSLQYAVDNWQQIVRDSGYGKQADSLLVDGWGDPLTVKRKGEEIEVTSKHL